MPANKPIWMMTEPIVIDSPGLALGIEIVASIGGSPYTFNSGVTAYPVMPAGTYAFWVFVAQTNATLREWIVNVALALGITTRPSIATTLLKFIAPTPLVPTADGNKMTVTFAPTGFAIGGNAMTLTSAQLDNTSGFWTRLGMVREGTAAMSTSSLTSVLATWDGAHQPSYLSVFERQGKDLGEVRKVKGNTRVLRDGTVRSHVFGSSRVDRQVRLYEHESPMLGSPIPIATFSSINGAREVLTLKTTDENGLVNVSNLYQNEDLITTGPYIRVGLARHVTRLDAKAGSPKTTSATLFEKASVNAAAEMTAGMTVYKCSEFENFIEKVLLFGYVIYHEPDDTTGQTRFKGEAYALVLSDETSVTPERVDDFMDLWEVTLDLVRIDVPGLIL